MTNESSLSIEDNESHTFGTGPNRLTVDVIENISSETPSQRWKAYVETPRGFLGEFVGSTKREARRGAFRYLKRMRSWLEPLDAYDD